MGDGAKEEPDDGHKQCGQEVEHLAVLQIEQRESGTRDEESANDEQFGHECIADGCAGELRHEVEHALPAEEHGCGEHHSDAVGGGEDGGRHEVERGVCEEEGVVAAQGADDGSEHGERSDAVEQYGGGEPVGKTLAVAALRAFVDGPFESSVDVDGRTDDAPYGECHDEEHGVLAFCEVADGGVEPDGEAGQSESVVECLLVLLLDAPVQQCPDDGACDDGGSVDNGSYHVVTVFGFGVEAPPDLPG